MNKYNKYKPSGIEWLGDIPEHWEVKRIKDIFKNFGSGTTPSTARTDYYENGNICWLNTTDLQNDYIFDTKIKITQKALKETGLKIYPKNSLAIAMYGQGKTRGTVGLLQIPTTTNQAACIMYKPIKANVKYILYWFIHKYNAIRSINIGATQPNMNQDFIKFLILQFPTLTEQTAIATYLDHKTAAIDKKTALLEKKIEYYKELRKSLINRTVTKGLNPNVKLKYSGIEWIGEIPEHWEVKRIKDIADIINGYAFDTREYVDNGIPIIRIGDISEKLNIENTKKVSSEYLNTAKMCVAENSDILFAMTGATIGKSAQFSSKQKFILNQRVCSFRVKKFNSDYLKFIVPANLFQDNIKVICGGSAQENIGRSQLDKFSIPHPPKEEQTAIATYLDKKTTKIDQIISNIKSQTEKLKELRKVLINDVVTGKIKVWEE